MNLNSQQLSRASYIVVSNEDQVTVTCNWCSDNITKKMSYFDLPNIDWVSAVAMHVHERHDDILRDPKYWEYITTPMS